MSSISMTLQEVLGVLRRTRTATLLTLAIALGACRTPVPTAPEPVDPCAGKKPLTADFKICAIHEVWFKGIEGVETVWLENDTINYGSVVGFEAKAEADEYEWFIGEESEPRFGKRVVVRFSHGSLDLVNKRYTITLITRRNKPDSLCLPGDKLADTVQKSFYLAGQNTTSLLGTYFGHVTGPVNDTATVEIWMWWAKWHIDFDSVDYTSWWYRMTGLQPGCYGGVEMGEPIARKLTVNHQSAWFQGDSWPFSRYEGIVNPPQCLSAKGWMRKVNDTLYIDYELLSETVSWRQGSSETGFQQKSFTLPKGKYQYRGVRLPLPARKERYPF